MEFNLEVKGTPPEIVGVMLEMTFAKTNFLVKEVTPKTATLEVQSANYKKEIKVARLYIEAVKRKIWIFQKAVSLVTFTTEEAEWTDEASQQARDSIWLHILARLRDYGYISQKMLYDVDAKQKLREQEKVKSRNQRFFEELKNLQDNNNLSAPSAKEFDIDSLAELDPVVDDFVGKKTIYDGIDTSRIPGFLFISDELRRDFYTVVEAILQRIGVRHPDITIIKGVSTSGFPKYDLIKNQSNIASFASSEQEGRYWLFRTTQESGWFMLDFLVELHQKTRTELPQWVRDSIEEFRDFEHRLKGVVAEHPGYEVALEPTLSPTQLHIVKDGQIVVWCKPKSPGYNWWHLRWDSEEGKSLAKAYLIKNNAETGESLPDRVQAEIEPPERKGGRKRLACNVWLEHMVNVKGRSVGSDSDKNELFKMWKLLWAFETGKDSDNPSDLADPWGSFTEAADYSPRPKNTKK